MKVSIEKPASGQPFTIKDESGFVLHHGITNLHNAFDLVERYGYQVVHVVDPDVQAY